MEVQTFRKASVLGWIGQW